MCRLFRIVLLGACLWTVPAAHSAAELSGDDLRSLDEQVQEIKSDVLGIAADLGRLEERLLYPTDTQLALFVKLDGAEEFRLDAVQVSINGRAVAHYIYSFKELEALQRGGVQRLYTGNVATGEHTLTVSYSGKLRNGNDLTGSRQFAFVKGIEPKLLGITLAGAGGQDGIQLGDW